VLSARRPSAYSQTVAILPRAISVFLGAVLTAALLALALAALLWRSLMRLV